MIQIDRFTKVILTVIAVLLALVLINHGRDSGVATPAQAAKPTVLESKTRLAHIQDIPIKDFQEVILLGDGKTFLIRVDDGVGVYQVQEYYPDR